MPSKKLALVIMLLVVPFLTLCAQPEKAEKKPEVVEIPIGVLVDLSGPLTTYGEDIKNTVTLAAEDVNKYFEEKGKNFRIKIYVEDTRVDPKIALEKVQSLYGKGVKLIVGPMGSGEVKQIAEFVNANKIIIISPSSTAIPKLIGVTKPEEKKYIFRFVATDDFQTKAIAKVAQEVGIKGVVITYIGNAWGKGLADYGKAEFEKLGIKVQDVVEYPDPPPTDFTPYIDKIESGVNELLKESDQDEVAVAAFTYEEVYTMLAQIPSDSTLLKIIWIGCDGNAKSRAIVDICDRVNAVKMYGTLFESRGKSFDELNKRYQERFGRSTYQYGLNAYDATWVLALSFAEVYEKLGKYDPDTMAKTIPVVTEKYSRGEYGVTPVSGYIKLNEYNDRASGDFAVWMVENCEWKMIGIWKSVENEVQWL